MTVTDDCELWRWSVVAYRRPGVPAACLRLQDEFGFDVNVALACVWVGQQQPELSKAQLIGLLDASAEARHAVEDIRALRRAAKEDPSKRASYEELKTVELGGEREVQARLHGWLVDHAQPDRTQGTPASTALASLRVYAEHLGRWPAADEALRVFVAAVL